MSSTSPSWISEALGNAEPASTRAPSAGAASAGRRDPDSLSAQIIERLTVVDYLNELGAKWKGRKASCPLHEDWNPSLHAYEEGGWKCYQCQKGGTVIDLHLLVEQLDRKSPEDRSTAILGLAERLGIDPYPVTVLDADPALLSPPPAPDETTRSGGGLPTGQPAPPVLEFMSFRDLAAKVDAAGPRRWLLRGLWPAGDYGIHAAEQKAQKTWNTCDLAVSVASSTPWLGTVPVDNPGPVVMFAGEGGEGNLVRRIRAIAQARGVTAEDLPIVVCARAPHLNSGAHLKEIADQLAEVRPVLVTLDPLYLSARGADKGDLYGMGEMLEGPQRICQAAGASLFVVTHFNRQAGKGAARITGAGPAEWGRVLLAASVISKHTDPETRATDVITELDAIGGEIPDQGLRIRRRIWSDDPDDLDAPLHIETTVEDPETSAAAPGGSDLTPAAMKLLGALEAADRQARSGSELVDWIAEKHGHGLKRETVSRTLNELERRGLVDSIEQEMFKPKLWLRADTVGTPGEATEAPL